MRGVLFLGDQTCEVREFADPSPRPGQVKVRMVVSGICGSDLWNYRKKPAQLKDKFIPGHEPSGIVEALGEGVRHVNVGDRVVVYHHLTCGRCKHCRAGNLMFCPHRKSLGHETHGAHADFVVVEERNVLPLPDELSFADGAVMACAGGTAFAALRKLGVSGRHTLAIFGQGPVGLSGLVLVKGMGARVICVEPCAERRQLSNTFGADHVIDPAEGGTESSARDLTGGEGVDVALIATGNSKARQEAVACLANGGKAVFVGVGDRRDSVDFSHLLWRELTLMGSFVMPIHMYWDLARFMIEKQISFERLITHRFALEQAGEAFSLFAEGKTGKVVFDWSE